MSLNEKEDVLNLLAYDNIADQGNPLVYTFLSSMLIKQETARTHFLISKIMGITLNFMPKAELIALYHEVRQLYNLPLTSYLQN